MKRTTATALAAATAILVSGCGGSLDPYAVNLEFDASAVITADAAASHVEVRLHVLNRGESNVTLLHGECPGRDFEIEIRDGRDVVWSASTQPGCIDIARLVPVSAAADAWITWRFPVAMLETDGLPAGEFDVWVRLMSLEPALDTGFLPAGTVEIR